MYTFVTATAKLLITSLDPSSTSLLPAIDDVMYVPNPVVVETKLSKNTTFDIQHYTGDIIVESYSKMLIDFDSTSTLDMDYAILKDTIGDYAFLTEDWDGYGGVAPSKAIIKTTIELLEKLHLQGFSIPKPMLSGSGEIGLYWKNNSIYTEITIDEPNSYSLYIEEGNAYSGKADIKIEEDLPQELISSEKKFSVV